MNLEAIALSFAGGVLFGLLMYLVIHLAPVRRLLKRRQRRADDARRDQPPGL
jgi:hypothetical protein